jgi:hypothetical protein
MNNGEILNLPAPIFRQAGWRENMPNYQTSGLITALYPGDPPAYAFNGESPAPPQASQQFALARPYGPGMEPEQAIAWQTSFASAPTVVTVWLQVADVDADANYATVDVSTATAGERRTISARAKFVRVKLNAQTGGGAITATIAA